MPGVQCYQTEIVGGFAILTAIYAVVYWIADAYQGLLQAAPQYCRNNQLEEDSLLASTCARPDLLAFQAASFAAQVVLASQGFRNWHLDKSTHPTTADGRLFQRLTSAEQLNAAILVYQLWDFVASLAIPEHATAGEYCEN
jgi:hypothetical protein